MSAPHANSTRDDLSPKGLRAVGFQGCILPGDMVPSQWIEGTSTDRECAENRLGLGTIRESAGKCDNVIHFPLGQAEVAELLAVSPDIA